MCRACPQSARGGRRARAWGSVAAHRGEKRSRAVVVPLSARTARAPLTRTARSRAPLARTHRTRARARTHTTRAAGAQSAHDGLDVKVGA
eukprot:2593903-Prymnesium_polylepis.2